MTNAVEVRHLSKSIEGSPILNDICMNVRQGEVYGFLGANGAGKTSLMETLSLLGIAETGTKAVGKFSLGMKQRLALARAMLTKPDLLLTSYLKLPTQSELLTTGLCLRKYL